ncbi:uncharacterized protein Tco025E_09600 [Trypanosoma conorhini]|uniref:Uncharacterized protein n=1 Tax=Trypanosoma conorhini TaxID=83891 RepID=A0A422MUM6_9TRYP|nr:uncharacterized protein Tco025E_09600 [Trypanosoma conorhini]RNE96928.1 hypothetical protein Tco025E_09600 [Trypanosoma conorhini]
MHRRWCVEVRRDKLRCDKCVSFFPCRRILRTAIVFVCFSSSFHVEGYVEGTNNNNLFLRSSFHRVLSELPLLGLQRRLEHQFLPPSLLHRCRVRLCGLPPFFLLLPSDLSPLHSLQLFIALSFLLLFHRLVAQRLCYSARPLLLLMATTLRRRAVCALALLALLCGGCCGSFVCATAAAAGGGGAIGAAGAEAVFQFGGEPLSDALNREGFSSAPGANGAVVGHATAAPVVQNDS